MALPSLLPPRAAHYSADVPVAPPACATCEGPCDTPYCPACGERRASDRPMSLAALGEELWDAFSPVDGRIARTVVSLVRRPGELTVAYMRGARLGFVPPLRVFLIVNVLFFLQASLMHSHALDTPLRTHLTDTAHSGVATTLVRGELGALQREWRARHGRAPTAADRAEIERDYARRFDASSTTQAKSLVIAMVPMFALLVAAVEWRRRRYALQDLIFSLHAMAALLLVFTFGAWIVGVPIALGMAAAHVRLSSHAQDIVYSAATMSLFALWMWAALRRAYGDGPVASLVKAAALSYAFVLVLFAYRALLFFTVFFTT